MFDLVVIDRKRFLSIVRRKGGFHVSLSFCLAAIERWGIPHQLDDDGGIVLTDELARHLGRWIWSSDNLRCYETGQVPVPTASRIKKMCKQLRAERPRQPLGFEGRPWEVDSRYSFELGRCGLLNVKVQNGRN